MFNLDPSLRLRVSQLNARHNCPVFFVDCSEGSTEFDTFSFGLNEFMNSRLEID